MTTIEPGIYKDAYAFEVRATVGSRPQQRTLRKRFPKTTPIETLRAWRLRALADLQEPPLTLTPEALPRSLDGWCYLYVVRVGHAVKIGRALDVAQRVRALQIGNHEPLELIAAVPAHAALESAVHDRFVHLRTDGEWFQLTDELLAFIDQLRAGTNPVALLFQPTNHQ